MTCHPEERPSARFRGIRRLAASLALLLSLPAAVVAAPPPFPWPNGAKAAVVLSYDDAVDVHLDNVAPDLEAVGFRGTFYLPGHSESLAKRLPEWRALAARGHELGNHAIFHPCLRNVPEGGRDWVRPEWALESYTVERIRAEVAAMNTTLLAIDGQAVRTFAYNCGDTTAGGQSYVDALRPMFLAARAVGDPPVTDVRAVDPMLVPSYMPQNVSGDVLVAFAKKAVDAGGLAVFTFHGVGGGHSIDVPREAHLQLLAWLDANRKTVWTDTFKNVMTHVVAEQNARRRRAEDERAGHSVDRRDVRRYLTSVRTRVSSKGQIVLPAEVRRLDQVEAGQEFEVERLDRGDYRLVRRASAPNAGVVDWLLACPEKGFFVPVESESTDSL